MSRNNLNKSVKIWFDSKKFQDNIFYFKYYNDNILDRPEFHNLTR